MTKGSVPPQFLSKMKKGGAGGGVAKGDRVSGPMGKGTVTKVKGAAITVQHDNGVTSKHPVMKIKKTAASTKKAAKKIGKK